MYAFCSSPVALEIIVLQVIAEGANGPTTIGAEKILQSKNVLVIPVSD